MLTNDERVAVDAALRNFRGAAVITRSKKYADDLEGLIARIERAPDAALREISDRTGNAIEVITAILGDRPHPEESRLTVVSTEVARKAAQWFPALLSADSMLSPDAKADLKALYEALLPAEVDTLRP